MKHISQKNFCVCSFLLELWCHRVIFALGITHSSNYQVPLILCRQILSRKKTFKICAIVWFVASALTFCAIASHFTQDLEELMLIYITLPLVLVILTFLQVMLKFAIVKEVMQSQRNTHVNGSQHNNNNHLQIAKIMFMLNMLFLVTAFPYFVPRTLEFIFLLSKVQNGFPWRFWYYYKPVVMLNFAVNPTAYASRLTDHRNSLKALFKKKKFVPTSV